MVTAPVSRPQAQRQEGEAVYGGEDLPVKLEPARTLIMPEDGQPTAVVSVGAKGSVSRWTLARFSQLLAVRWSGTGRAEKVRLLWQ